MTDRGCGFTEEEVLAFVAGELDDDSATGVAEHLGGCEGCRDAAADYRALETTLSECCEDGLVRWHRFPVAFGRLHLAATDDGIARISWEQEDDDAFVRELAARFPGRPIVRDRDGLLEAQRQLEEYFAGARTSFDLRVDLSRLSDFDRRVLDVARRLGHGQVVSYGELARRIGRPRAARAVGNALGRNPVAIVVPCHRVIRSDGTLGGYGGGVEYKQELLRLEGREDLLRAS